MLDSIKAFLLDFFSAVQAVKMYAEGHPSSREAVGKAERDLADILGRRAEVTLGLVDQELAWEGEILFELSQKTRSFLAFLKERGVERMTFLAPFRPDEFERFVAALADPKYKDAEAFQRHLQTLGLRMVKAGKMKAAAAPAVAVEAGRPGGPEAPPPSAFEISAAAALLPLRAVLDGTEVRAREQGLALLDLLGRFGGKNRKFLSFAAFRDKDAQTYAHLLNVAILTMFLAAKSGFSEEEVREAGQAALFHDIGKIYLAREVLGKPKALTPSEFSLVQDHSVLGARILLRYKDALGTLPAIVAFEHHLRYDLKGYPKLPFPCPPHPVSLMVSLCDVYDALAQRRSYKKTFPPLEIHALISREKGKMFDPRVVDDFYKFMGVWPVGMVVALNDGRAAVVREANERDIFRPVVEIVGPESQRGTLLDLADEAGRVEVDRRLDPALEGGAYLDFV
ncbi:MAG: HD domain-containing protein [Candidatus Aminicenantes bacterium]|nr:HD domain-containing protein [Candidatus Aminicenantes bacterium]